MNDDNLRTLVILHRVYAGIMALGSCCAGLYVTFVLGLVGVATATAPPKPGEPPPAGILAFVGVIWLFVIGLLLAYVVLNLLCANWLRDRRHWLGVVIVSGFNCLHMPLGIALAVYTLIVVNRQDVRNSFSDR